MLDGGVGAARRGDARGDGCTLDLSRVAANRTRKGAAALGSAAAALCRHGARQQGETRAVGLGFRPGFMGIGRALVGRAGRRGRPRRFGPVQKGFSFLNYSGKICFPVPNNFIKLLIIFYHVHENI